jgi:hypothetical protein
VPKMVTANKFVTNVKVNGDLFQELFVLEILRIITVSQNRQQSN